jgi:dTDP-glucose pyrophosphorylase
VEFDGSCRIFGVTEKPPEPKSNFVIAGIYKLTNRTMRYFEELSPSSRGEFEMPDVIRKMIADGVIIGAVPLDGMVDVGAHGQLQRLQEQDL